MCHGPLWEGWYGWIGEGVEDVMARGERYVHEGSIVADPAASTSSPVLPASILCFLFRALVAILPGGGCRYSVIG